MTKFPMRAVCVLAVSVLTGSFTRGSDAANEWWSQNGTCQPATTADASLISYSHYGIQNNSTTTTANVACGTVHPASVTVFEVLMNAYDRNTSSNLCCTAYASDIDGDVLESSTFCTAGSGANHQQVYANFSDPSAYGVTVFCSIPPKQSGSLSHLVRTMVLTNMH